MTLIGITIFNSFKLVKVIYLGNQKWKTFKSLYGELRKSNELALHFNSIFIVHRLSVAVILVYIKDYPSI